MDMNIISFKIKFFNVPSALGLVGRKCLPAAPEVKRWRIGPFAQTLSDHCDNPTMTAIERQSILLANLALLVRTVSYFPHFWLVPLPK